MTLQEQVCTLEQAQRLKELGCEQESLYYWSPFTWSLPEKVRWGLTTKDEIKHPTDAVLKVSASAYTVAELGEMLITAYAEELPSVFAYSTVEWSHVYLTDYYPTEAQARAALLIHILEQEKP